ncbi:MAG: hypothetical protein JWN79_3303 [Gemmatimonadetes bacterium]|nr:hypothetical protein [Gemmatimonadota bacterium]
MIEFKRDGQEAPVACARCGSDRTVVGTVLAESEVRFRPRGLRWWKLNRGVPLVPATVQGCLDCGRLLGFVDPAELRETIRRAEGDELRAALTRARPATSSGSRGPPDVTLKPTSAFAVARFARILLSALAAWLRRSTTTTSRAFVYTPVYSGVRFTRDPEKSERSLAERGFDFAFAASVFAGPTLERIDTRQDYSEVRRIALGVADEIPYHRLYRSGRGWRGRASHQFGPSEQSP